MRARGLQFRLWLLLMSLAFDWPEVAEVEAANIYARKSRQQRSRLTRFQRRA